MVGLHLVVNLVYFLFFHLINHGQIMHLIFMNKKINRHKKFSLLLDVLFFLLLFFQMYSLKFSVFRRSIYQLSYRLSSSSHTFPNEDLLFTVRSHNDHIRSGWLTFLFFFLLNFISLYFFSSLSVKFGWLSKASFTWFAFNQNFSWYWIIKRELWTT